MGEEHEELKCDNKIRIAYKSGHLDVIEHDKNDALKLAREDIKQIYEEEFKKIKCPEPCETWLRLHIDENPWERIAPMHGFHVFRFDWQIDVFCYNPNTPWPFCGEKEPKSEKRKGKDY